MSPVRSTSNCNIRDASEVELLQVQMLATGLLTHSEPVPGPKKGFLPRTQGHMMKQTLEIQFLPLRNTLYFMNL